MFLISDNLLGLPLSIHCHCHCFLPLMLLFWGPPTLRRHRHGASISYKFLYEQNFKWYFTLIFLLSILSFACQSSAQRQGSTNACRFIWKTSNRCLKKSSQCGTNTLPWTIRFQQGVTLFELLICENVLTLAALFFKVNTLPTILKHCKSAKLPWRHNIKLSFCSLFFVFLSVCMFVCLSVRLFVFFVCLSFLLFVFLSFFVFIFFVYLSFFPFFSLIFFLFFLLFFNFVFLSFCFFVSFCLFAFLSFCFFLDISLWSYVLRTSSVKSHSLCWNSKVAVTQWLTKVRYRATRAAKKNSTFPSRKGVQARKISVWEEDISRDSIGAALSKKSSICDANVQKKKTDASILNDNIPACSNDSLAEKKRD